MNTARKSELETTRPFTGKVVKPCTCGSINFRVTRIETVQNITEKLVCSNELCNKVRWTKRWRKEDVFREETTSEEGSKRNRRHLSLSVSRK